MNQHEQWEGNQIWCFPLVKISKSKWKWRGKTEFLCPCFWLLQFVNEVTWVVRDVKGFFAITTIKDKVLEGCLNNDSGIVSQSTKLPLVQITYLGVFTYLNILRYVGWDVSNCKSQKPWLKLAEMTKKFSKLLKASGGRTSSKNNTISILAVFLALPSSVCKACSSSWLFPWFQDGCQQPLASLLMSLEGQPNLSPQVWAESPSHLFIWTNNDIRKWPVMTGLYSVQRAIPGKGGWFSWLI